MVRTLSMIVVATLLAACAGTAHRNAELYTQARAADERAAQAAAIRESEAQAARAAESAALASHCIDDACRTAVAANLALRDAIAALARGATPQTAPTPVPYGRDGAAKFRDVLSGASPLLLGLAGEWRNVELGAQRRDVDLGNQQRELGTVQAVAGLGGAIAAQPPGIYVGGNYGDTDNSTRGDVIRDSGNSTITDSQNGDHAGRDIVGRDVIDNSGNLGSDNRQGSDGPIDNSDPGDDCDGASCNPTTPPPEEIDP